jgi:hypothetical protein
MAVGSEGLWLAGRADPMLIELRTGKGGGLELVDFAYPVIHLAA